MTPFRRAIAINITADKMGLFDAAWQSRRTVLLLGGGLLLVTVLTVACVCIGASPWTLPEQPVSVNFSD